MSFPSQPDQLLVPLLIWQAMVDHASICLPEECCGLLGGGLNGAVASAESIFPVTNILHSPVRFYMDPGDQVRILQEIEDRQMELTGIFHSHPKGPQVPSETDIQEFFYPGVAALILAPQTSGRGWGMRAFHIFRLPLF